MNQEFPLEFMPEGYLDLWLTMVRENPDQLQSLPEPARSLLTIYERQKAISSGSTLKLV